MWKTFFEKEEQEEYYKKLMASVEDEYKNHICYPSHDNIFHAFKACEDKDIKVVILGQDPYHEPNQAHGLAFSVLCSKLPPSLVNIYKEMESDLGVEVSHEGNLDYLAKQGVFLLNTVLTVRKGEAFSHKDLGWLIFTDHVIEYLDSLPQTIVFILWGAPAERKKNLLKNPNHYILSSAHPSPLSAYRGFFGSKPFSKTNAILKQNNVKMIDWYIDKDKITTGLFAE